MLMREKMIVAILIIAIAFGTVTEFQFRMRIAVSPADCTLVNNSGLGLTGRLSDGLPPYMLHAGFGTAHACPHKPEKENDKIQNRQSN